MTDRRETQGTIASFDPADRSGTLILDDGVLLPFRGAVVSVAVRGLRLGQRVRVRLEGAGAEQSVDALTIITLPADS